MPKMMTGECDVVRARRTMSGDETSERRIENGTGAVSPRRRVVAIVVAMLMGIAGLLGGALPAAAAPTVTYPGAISNVVLEGQNGGGPLEQWQTVRISGDWSVPEGAHAGETFGMTLPAEFSRQAAGTFDILDPETNEVMATCVVAAGQGPDMVCTLTDAVEGKEDVGGTFWMQARASQSTTDETVEFDLGDTIEIVDLPGDGGIVPTNPTEQAKPYKFGGQTTTDGRLKWVVGVPSGYVTDGSFTIADTLDGTHSAHHYTGEVLLRQQAVENGQLVGGWTVLGPESYQTVFADDGGSFRFTASGLPHSGFAYELIYYTQADGPVAPGDVFGNKAVVNTFETSATHTVTESGGGGGTGVEFTRFSIMKQLTGPLAEAARSATYTVRYSVKGSDAPATAMTVPVGESVASTRAPLGSTFVIEEVDLPSIEGVTWGPWTITGEGVVDVGNGTFEVTPSSNAGVALTLTNTANPVTPPPSVPPTTPPPSVPPTVPPTPTPPPGVRTPPPGGLALTGGEIGYGFLALAVALIAGGGIATGVAARRRASAEQL